MRGDQIRAIRKLPDGTKEIIFCDPDQLSSQQQQPIEVPSQAQQYDDLDRACPYQTDRPVRRPRRRRRRRKQRIAGKLVLLFTCSWIPTAFGHPGGTFLICGLTAAWLANLATRGE